jgi:Spy/CpxP family protein refolding chaperone
MSKVWTRRAFWWGGGALATAVAAFAVSPRVMAFHRGEGGFGGHRGFGFMHGGPESAKDKAAMATDWMLRSVDGTDEQKQEARRITDRLVDEMQPFAQQHRELREAMLRELGKPEVDREELERLRQDGIKLADAASKAAVSAVGDFASVLKPEQRAQLLEWAERMHSH